jgi:hypothetical protein
VTENFFYYEPADYLACEYHMAAMLNTWFPHTAERCKVANRNYIGWNINALIDALEESREILPGHLHRIGAATGNPRGHCRQPH